MNIFNARHTAPRGFTLVELMITVAIIGILASVASVTYTKYTKSAKITQLKQYAMEVSNAQEQYKSQNSGYFNAAAKYSEGSAEWERLLGFKKKGLADQDITVETKAGASGDTCTICEGVAPDNTSIWFAVRVQQDMKKGGKQTTVILHNELPNPVILNEGE